MSNILNQVKQYKIIRNPLFIGFHCAVLILMILLVARIVRPNQTYVYEAEGNFTCDSDKEVFSLYQGIPLSPGRYYAHVEYNANADKCGIVSLQDAHVYTKGLLANYELLYEHKDATDLEFWLMEQTDSLEVTMTLTAPCAVTVFRLVLEETNGLWTMLLSIVLFLLIVIDAGLFFWEKDQIAPVKTEKKVAFLGVLIIAFIASLPFFMNGIMTGADLGYHIHRMEAVPADLMRGIFPTRIAADWPYGMGYADPVFYGNALLYIYALFRLLGFPLMISYQLFAVVINLLAASIAYFAYSRIFHSRRLGLFCSALYTLCVIRLYKFAVVGALGEGCAHTFLPLILLGLYEICAEEKVDNKKTRSWLFLGIGYAGVIQTHVLSTEITALTTILICLLCIRTVLQPKRLLQILKGAGTAFLLSAWYLIPFLDYFLTQDVNIKHAAARTIQREGMYPGELLYLFANTTKALDVAEESMAYKMPAGGGFILVTGLLVFLALWFMGYLGQKDLRTAFLKKCSLTALCLLLFTQQFFPWDKLQASSKIAASLISSIQFPHRFLGWGSCLMVLLMGSLFVMLEDRAAVWGKYITLSIVLISTIGSLFFINYMGSYERRSKIYTEESVGMGYVAGGEYLIYGTDESVLTYDTPKYEASVLLQSYEKDGTTLQTYCINTSDEEAYVDFPLLSYKGYHAICQETGEKLTLGTGENNWLRLSLPGQFYGTVRIHFASPLYWRIAEVLSLGYVICLFVGAFRSRKKKEGYDA